MPDEEQPCLQQSPIDPIEAEAEVEVDANVDIDIEPEVNAV